VRLVLCSGIDLPERHQVIDEVVVERVVGEALQAGRMREVQPRGEQRRRRHVAPQDRLRVSFVMCQDSDYQRPLFVRTQTVNVMDEARAPAAVTVSTPMPPVPQPEAPIAVMPHAVTNTKHN